MYSEVSTSSQTVTSYFIFISSHRHGENNFLQSISTCISTTKRDFRGNLFFFVQIVLSSVKKAKLLPSFNLLEFCIPGMNQNRQQCGRMFVLFR